ncbi:MAG: 50S ribosomal protein L29 [Patescibacteria group bacterium]
MKKTSYIGKAAPELQKALADKRVVLRDFRFSASGAKKNVKAGREAKKDIARIMTELNRNK